MTNGAIDGLLFCGNILIPSLFPFMVLSSFLVYSGLSFYISKIFGIINKTLFNLPSITCATVFLGMFGGFPVGARGIRSMLDEKQITEITARQMLYFSVGAGPAFVVFAVGLSMLNSVYYGVLLFCSQLISQIILAIIIGCHYKKKYANTTSCYACKSVRVDFSTAIVKSCSDAVTGVLNLCGMVILFSAFMGIIADIKLDTTIQNFLINIGIEHSIAKTLLASLLEVTTFCNLAHLNNTPIEFIAFGIGFSGLCVHFQVFSALGNLKFSKKMFFVCRFFQGVISTLLTHIALIIYNPTPTTDVFSNLTNAPTQSISTTFLGAMALIFTSICFIFANKLTKRNAIAYNNK